MKISQAAILIAVALAPGVSGAKSGPKAIEPEHALKPPEGYFDEAFALEPGGARLYVVRTDGATFAKLELVDLSTGTTAASWDVPKEDTAVERLEALPAGKGVVLIAREGTPEAPKLVATLIDATGKPGAKVGPAHAFGRPSGAADLLVAFDRQDGPREHDVTYTVTPYKIETLAPFGKPRVYKTTSGELKSPPFRVLDFVDGYSRIVGEKPRTYVKKNDVREPPRKAILDALTGKIVDEAPIADVLGWAELGKLRARHPGRLVFADLNQDDSGVDVVDAMGGKHAVDLAVPFGLYDPKSLHGQDGPEPGAFYFGIAVDPLNAEAVKRQKPDLPMLDVYGSKKREADGAAPAAMSMLGRIFIPRNVTWRAGYGKLVVLKRFKSFTRGGDEVDIYALR
jgi:hypothetical protein